jgi:hypothetical protein
VCSVYIPVHAVVVHSGLVTSEHVVQGEGEGRGMGDRHTGLESQSSNIYVVVIPFK